MTTTRRAPHRPVQGAALVAPPAPRVSRSALDIPAQYVKGVGPARAAQLARLGLRTVEDLFWHRPRRYEDRSRLAPIAALTVGQKHTVQGTVLALSEKRHGTYQFIAALTDDTGVLQAVWFGQRYLRRIIRRGARLIVHGKVERFGALQMVVDEYEILSGSTEDTLHTGRVVPIHPATEGLSPRALRTIVDQALQQYLADVPELLPDVVRRRHGFIDVRSAIRSLHFPAAVAEAEAGRRRLAFDEFLVMQLGVLRRRQAARAGPKEAHYAPQGNPLQEFVASLPFDLTAAQHRVIDEITGDLRSPRPMHRLLQGDVGSGKTVVAGAALWLCVSGGYQGALMAPTEILAEQHFLTFRRLLTPLGMQVALVTGGATKKDREQTRAALAAGEVDVAVGTHALLESAVAFARLGLVVVDEQHKFGVMQRATLRRKGFHPDVLVMTATPIPRTLAMTLYGDLDVSVIDEMPPGRGTIKTYVRGPEKRPEVYGWVRDQIRSGHRAYIVCPLIEESEKLQAEAAVKLAERLRRDVFAGLSVGLLHGRMRPEEKDAEMDRFRRGEIGVLVATPVIEVGIDVPQATIMVVEDADRFGLAQLHQLRGRVGRGAQTSYCVLLAEASTDAARVRLETMETTRDGFVVAQRDLELRGPGEMLGTRQHGVPELRVADLIADLPLLEQARQEAQRILGADPALQRPEHAVLRERVGVRFAAHAGVASVS